MSTLSDRVFADFVQNLRTLTAAQLLDVDAKLVRRYNSEVDHCNRWTETWLSRRIDAVTDERASR